MCGSDALRRRHFLTGAAALFAGAALPIPAAAKTTRGSPRELWLLNAQTGQSLRAYLTMDGTNLWRGNSQYAGYDHICWLLRDLHENAEGGISVHLLEAAWETQQVLYVWGYEQPIAITSGFRTVETNSEVGGARYSYHMSGNAIDFFVPGTPLLRVWQAAGSRSYTGGMGWYTGSHIHIDTGPRRYWVG